MVLLLVTPALQLSLSRYCTLYDLPPSLSAACAPAAPATPSSPSSLKQSIDDQRTISHELLVQLVKWTKSHPHIAAIARQSKSTGADPSPQPTDLTLSFLLSQTEVYAPPLRPREKSPALIALLASLQLAADQRTYKSMTSLASITSSESAYSRSLNQQSISRLPLRDDHAAAGMDGGAGTSDGWDDVRKEVAAITNVGASMLAMAISVWWVGGGRSIGMRLGLALTAAVLIGGVESFLYYRHFTRKATGMSERQKMKDSKELRLSKVREAALIEDARGSNVAVTRIDVA